ncbi:MAG: YdcH family protein [Verrucomicrobiales bacterium]
MSIEHHSLVTEFPDHRDAIHKLKQENAHFHKLMTKYEEVDKEIVRMEEGIETPEDAVVTNVKKQRLELKDELLAMLLKEEK